MEIVNYLIDHGVDCDICTAAMLGNLDWKDDFLMEDPNLINARCAHGIPLLYFPVIHAKADLAEYLYSMRLTPVPPPLEGSHHFMVR